MTENEEHVRELLAKARADILEGAGRADPQYKPGLRLVEAALALLGWSWREVP